MNIQELQAVARPIIEKMAKLDLGKVKRVKALNRRKEQKRQQIQAIRRRNGWQPPTRGLIQPRAVMRINPDRY